MLQSKPVSASMGGSNTEQAASNVGQAARPAAAAKQPAVAQAVQRTGNTALATQLSQGVSKSGLKTMSVRQAFNKAFLEVFKQQNPGATEVPLRGQIYFVSNNGKLEMAKPKDGVKFSKDEIAFLRDKGLRLSWMLESEGKLTSPRQIENNQTGRGLDDERFDAIYAALNQAVAKNDMTSIVGSEIAKEMKAQGYKLIKNEKKRDARPFQDLYYDDKNGALTRLDITLRMRQVDNEIGTSTGRFTCKILEGNDEGVWRRGEIKFTASSDFPVGDFFVPGKIPDFINPIFYLCQAYPEIDRASLAPAVVIKDARHEFNVEKDPKPGEKYGDALYLVTLDKVNPSTPDGRRSSHYFEIENERIVPSDDPQHLAEQKRFMRGLAKTLGLVPSPKNKAETGMQAVDSAGLVRGAANAAWDKLSAFWSKRFGDGRISKAAEGDE